MKGINQAVLFALMMSVSVCGNAFAEGLEKLRVSVIPISDIAPLQAAIKNGYFRELGLDVDTTPSVGGASGIPGMIGGSYDIVYGNVVSALLAVRQGLDIKIIAPGTKWTTADTDSNYIAVNAAAGIQDGKGLEGKAVAVNTRNNVIWLYARAWIKKTGGNPDRVTFKEVPFPQMEDALRQNRVDAAFLVAPFSAVASKKAGLAYIGKPFTDVQSGVDVGQYLTTSDIFAKRSKAIDSFVIGLRRGIDWYNAHRQSDELTSLIAEFTKVDASLLRSIAIPEAPSRSDPAQISTTMNLMIENGLLDKPINLDAVIAATAL